MFLPYGDNNPTSRVPIVNNLLILVNVLVYLVINFREDAIKVILANALHPDSPTFSAFVTCMFLHGGFMHLFGNVLALHIYGDNVEEKFGHFAYLIFYFLTGFVASFFHLATDTMPCVGASGAIAGVMGAYIFLYPVAKVKCIFVFWLLPPIYKKFELYSWFLIGVWFTGQLLSHNSGDTGGVAVAAHIGGFIAGAVVSGLLVLAKVVKMDVMEPSRVRALERAELQAVRAQGPPPNQVDIQGRFEEERQNGIPCPACIKAMPFTQIDGHKIEQCFECGGMWLEKATLEHLLRKPELPYSLLNPAARAPGNILVEAGSRSCSHCLSALTEVNLEGVQTEGCAVCRAIWLERGELGDLKERLRA